MYQQATDCARRPDAESKRRHSAAAFTLIELSIVLVVIGLLVGTIIASRTMIRQSQINSSMTDIQQYVKASLAFRDKYAALPGDMANSTSYWGSTGSPCAGVQGTGTQTCDGDGNGQIGTSATALSGNYEQLRFWQHLVNGQFITGSYTGVGDTNGAYDHLPGTNVPKSRIDGAGYSVGYVGVITSGNTYWTGTYGHVFTIGNHTTGTIPYAATLTPEEAAAYDAKYDDGLPASGNIQTFNAVISTTCVTNASGTYAYTTTKSILCSLLYISGF